MKLAITFIIIISRRAVNGIPVDYIFIHLNKVNRAEYPTPFSLPGAICL